MEKVEKKYYIRLEDSRLVEVSKEVYIVYYKMKREERYQIERDLQHGLLHYDEWDSEDTNGAEYIADKMADTEKEALDHIANQALWELIEQTGNQSDLCRLIAEGKTECEIAEILGINQSTVNRNKKRLYSKLRKILK